MPLTFPTSANYKNGVWRVVSNAARFTSPITRVTQAVGRIGDYWAGSIELPPLSRWEDADAVAEFSVFLAKIAGGAESFYMRPPVDQRHDVDGAPQVDGAGQAGKELKIKGLANGDILRAGSYISYETSTFRMLHMVTATLTAGGTGKVDCPIFPAIRKAPANSAAINVLTPSCEMMIDGAGADVLTLNDVAFYGHSFGFAEAVRA
ncbi:MAG TPA: hypothetical protein PLS69_14745 [Terricaulis sp.]|nr:hypothetical protein [Terricaulis sp.]